MDPSPPSSFNRLRPNFSNAWKSGNARFACVPNEYLLVYRTASRLSRCFALLWCVRYPQHPGTIESRIFLSAFADNFCKSLNWTSPLQDFRIPFRGLKALSGSDDAQKTSKPHRFRCRICRPLRRVRMKSTTYLLTDKYTTSAKGSKKARNALEMAAKSAQSPLSSAI